MKHRNHDNANTHKQIQIRDNLETSYPDVFTPQAKAALASLSNFNPEQKSLMSKRIKRRAERVRNKQRITFLDEMDTIPRTHIKVHDAREGKFVGSEIPEDLQQQWIQGTGPGAKPHAPLENSIRNVAYALLSGADGWMFDGEDALGQITTMSLDNQRNLKLAIHKDPIFLKNSPAGRRDNESMVTDISRKQYHRRLGETIRFYHKDFSCSWLTSG